MFLVSTSDAPGTAQVADSIPNSSTFQTQPSTWTLDALISHCASWQPKIAAQQRNSDLCVSGLITTIEWRGKTYELQLLEGRWVAIYVRVSTPAQRSGRSNHKSADGFSELHQLRACIEWCIVHGYAFKVYSDAGITSAYPPDQAHLIRVLLKAKADRYAKIYTRVWLSDAAKIKHTTTEQAAMVAYRDKKVAKIKAGPFRDAVDVLPALGQRRNSRVFHRQAMTQLWQDMESRSVHLVALTDKSRLLRSADLEKLFFELAGECHVKMHATEESMLHFDVGEEDQKGTLYMLASLNEKKLTEATSNSMKGFTELLRGGKPHSSLPFWLTRDAEGNAVIVPENVPLVHQVIDLYLADAGGATAIASHLLKQGVALADGRELTKMMVSGVLDGVEIAGIQKHFGLDWPVLPAVVSAETVEDLRVFREAKEQKVAEVAEVGGPVVRAHHLFRSLAFCACGRQCQHHDDYNIYEPIGYLLCHRKHRKASAEFPGGHAYFPESVLAAWMDAVMPHVDHLIQSIGPGEERVRQRKQEISDMESQICDGEAKLMVRRDEAMETARRNAPLLGIPTTTPNFAQAIVKIAEAIIAADVEAVDALRTRTTLLAQEATADRAATRLQANLHEVSNWPNLDTATKNRILRAVFDKIVLPPSPLLPKRKNDLIAAGQLDKVDLNQGTMTLHLRGVAEPLPPVKMYRGSRSGRAVCLQSPSEWLRAMFGIEANECEISPQPSRVQRHVNSTHLRSFLTFMRGYIARHEADPVGLLADAIRNDKGQPRKRLTVKSYVRAYLKVRGLTDEALGALDEAWETYMEEERYRIVRVLTRRWGKAEAEEAWESYLYAQERKQRQSAA